MAAKAIGGCDRNKDGIPKEEKLQEILADGVRKR